MGESLGASLANDDSVWGRVWFIAGMISALLAGLLTPVWLFALITHYVMIAGMRFLPSGVVAAIALITFVAALVRHSRLATERSMQTLMLTGISVFAIALEWFVVVAWPWEGAC